MIEVLKQALEALDEITDDVDGTGLNTNMSFDKSLEAITSLRQAIAELESQDSNPIKDGWQLSVADGHSGYGVYAHMNEYPEEGAFLLLPIKELESQEPVAWRTFDGEGQYEYRAYEENESYADDWNKRNPNHKGWVEPLYAHPPQRKPLTDEQVEKIIKANMSFQMNLAGIRQDFEAAHDIKE